MKVISAFININIGEKISLHKIPKARVKCRTSHEPNRMQMRKTRCSPSLAFDPAHVKCGVWPGLNRFQLVCQESDHSLARRVLMWIQKSELTSTTQDFYSISFLVSLIGSWEVKHQLLKYAKPLMHAVHILCYPWQHDPPWIQIHELLSTVFYVAKYRHNFNSLCFS